MTAAADHLSPGQLQAYWLHETSPAETDAIDEHLMHCERCGEQLDELAALGRGIRDALRAGQVAVVTSAAFVQRLAAQGRRVREYRLPHNGSVYCTAAPDDELLVSRLQAPLQGIERLDVVTQTSLEPGTERRLQDIPFDAAAGEVVWIENLSRVRRLPQHTMWLTLVAAGPDGERPLARYTFLHTPWAAGTH